MNVTTLIYPLLRLKRQLTKNVTNKVVSFKEAFFIAIPDDNIKVLKDD